MNSSTPSTSASQVSVQKGPLDGPSLSQWLTETRELTGVLHEVAMDATSPERVHSRKELRRRASRLTRRLRVLFDALEPTV